MKTLQIYLTYKGNCRQAFEFYSKVFNRPYDTISTFGEMPRTDNMPPIPDNMKDYIMHVSLSISDGYVIMGSDTGGEWAPDFKMGNNFSISVTVDSREEADALFQALSEDGHVTMPMAETFWQAYFGMVKDQFGINWMVNYNLPEHKNA